MTIGVTGRIVEFAACLSLFLAGILFGLVAYGGIESRVESRYVAASEIGPTMEFADLKALFGGTCLSVGAVLVLLARAYFADRQHKREHDERSAMQEAKVMRQLIERTLDERKDA